MGTIKHQLDPEGALMPTSNHAPLAIKQGTNFPVSSLLYDATTAESAFWKLVLNDYGASNPNITVKVFWYADSASSGGVVWGASIAAITPDSDTQDVETDSLATENTATDTHLGTTGQRVHQISITVSNLDSAAADDEVFLRVRRLPADAGDTMTGDAQLIGIELSYSDT